MLRCRAKAANSHPIRHIYQTWLLLTITSFYLWNTSSTKFLKDRRSYLVKKIILMTTPLFAFFYKQNNLKKMAKNFFLT